MVETLSIKDIIFSDSPSALNTNEILDLGYWPRSASITSSTNKTPLKPTSNTPSKEYQARTRPQIDNRNIKHDRDYPWQFTVSFKYQLDSRP